MPYIGKTPLTGAYQLCDTITTSATATYNLLVGGSGVIPGSAQNCIVSLNGVIQAPVTAFTVSGSTITFASTLSATDVIDFILILGNVFDIGTPSNGSVTNSSLNSNVITGQTAVTTPATDDVLLCYDTSATALRKITFADFGNAPAFEARLSADQIPVDNVITKVNNNTEVYDTNNAYDNVTNYRFTPQVAGKYFVYGKVRGQSDTSSQLDFVTSFIYKNGAAVTSSTTMFRDNYGRSATPFVATVVIMNGSSDYVELFGQINVISGGLDGFLGNNGETLFGAYRLIGV